MRMSKLLAPTLRENPAEAEVVSHQLLVRAGYIRRLANGVYNYLPLMWRVLRKVEQIVREEMDQAGAQELLMPILQPAEVWQASGRWDVYGDLMMRVKDRHDRLYGLAPTAEEVITDIATKEVRSYRQLPVNLYQIQTKYRDEIRPRFGLLRGREFIMKDAYSFHSTQESLDREYENMADTYTRIFNRCGLETRQVRSDSGSIGGSVSHEYMVLTRIAPGEQESGENEVFYCDSCDYAANVERADSILPNIFDEVVLDSISLTDSITDKVMTAGKKLYSEYLPSEKVPTPNCSSIDTLASCLNISKSSIAKALLYIKDEKEPILVYIRGDLDGEEVKILNAVQANTIRMADDEEVSKYFFGAKKGYIGTGDPEQFHHLIRMGGDLSPGQYRVHAENQVNGYRIPILFDYSIASLNDFVIGINQTGWHKVKYNWAESLFRVPDASFDLQRNAPINSELKLPATMADSEKFDMKRARVGDICPECKIGQLQMTRGIEVGNIFQLGTKYSSSMNATYTDEDGSEKPFIMGCYGIGVSRTAAAAIERFHDKFGIIWPMSLAPYQVVIIIANSQDETQRNLAEQIYQQLQNVQLPDSAKKIEVVLDDRDERAGVKFKDADLIGFPIRITAGKKAPEGLLEVKLRDQDQARDILLAEVPAYVQQQILEWRPFASKISETAPV